MTESTGPGLLSRLMILAYLYSRPENTNCSISEPIHTNPAALFPQVVATPVRSPMNGPSRQFGCGLHDTDCQGIRFCMAQFSRYYSDGIHWKPQPEGLKLQGTIRMAFAERRHWESLSQTRNLKGVVGRAQSERRSLKSDAFDSTCSVA